MLKRHPIKNKVLSVYRSPLADQPARTRRAPLRKLQGLPSPVTSAFSVLTERRGESPNLKPKKRKLSKQEKLALAKKIAGSAKFFTKEGHEESHRIARRDDWED